MRKALLYFSFFLALFFIFSCKSKEREKVDFEKYDKDETSSTSQKKSEDVDFEYTQEVKPYIYNVSYPNKIDSGYQVIDSNIKNSVDQIVADFKNSVMPLEDIIKLGLFDEKNESETYSKMEFDNPQVVYAFSKKIVSIILPYYWSYGSDTMSSNYLVKTFNLENDDIYEIDPSIVFENNRSKDNSQESQDLYAKLSEYCIKYMDEGFWKSIENESELDRYSLNLQARDENFRMWSLHQKEQKLVFYYNTGIIAPDNQGSIKIEVPFSELTPLRMEYNE